MKKMTLNSVIKSQRKNDPDFDKHYQRELLINEVSKMVIALRNSAHFTQAELAHRAGTTQPVIARLESGTDHRIPSLSLLSRIAAASHAALHISFNKVKSTK
ncbi:MAG: helix-turn-helix transcriptional regulator [Gammaproteobacteria bacterium]|nr:helix-turn-helix transcriptional regulator [Gammaproteobacteria bacterium]